MRTEEVKNLMDALNTSIQVVLQMTNYDKYEELNLDLNPGDPNDQFLKEQYMALLEQLTNTHTAINYLQQPVVEEGQLSRNRNGRFELNDSYELSSGCPLEFLHYDDFDNCHKWIASRIEHSTDYYIVGYKELSLEGLKVRVRKNSAW